MLWAPQKAGWDQGPVWMGGKSRPYRDSILDRPARSSVAIPSELPGPPVSVRIKNTQNIPFQNFVRNQSENKLKKECTAYEIITYLNMKKMSSFKQRRISHILVQNLDAGLLAKCQYSEGPSIGYLGTGFSWFPCIYKQMLRWFVRLQVATTCFSCSPPDLYLVVINFMFCLHVK